MLRTMILIGIGGALGSVLRYLTTVLANRVFPAVFPVGTFVVNIAGCLLIGLLLGFLDRHQTLNPDLKLLLITGFCGGYTTFSAFASENVDLFQQGHAFTAFAYIAASVIFGLLAVWLGFFLIKLAYPPLAH